MDLFINVSDVAKIQTPRADVFGRDVFEPSFSRLAVLHVGGVVSSIGNLSADLREFS
jgi:hypothetical protein